ncbi:MAG TPA: diaminopimelate epimerase [Acidimicrobiales bacterium]|nr:diaminopimelate epimerase [Acidimicrobiales bacterium]
MRALQKWHGAGNDFLVDVQGNGATPWWTPTLAREVCHRAFGVGADGLLVATLGDPVSMVLYNADGSSAEMSGNGIRCLAAAVRRATRANWRELDVATEAGRRRVFLAMEGSRGEGSVAMGEVIFSAPLEGTLGVAHVGNPHVVVLDDPAWSVAERETMAAHWSAAVGGANVEFISVRDPRRLVLTVFERGVGWTLACGTGSVASAAVARRAGLTGDDVAVVNPGGELRVILDGLAATLQGPVEFIADVEWNTP